MPDAGRPGADPAERRLWRLLRAVLPGWYRRRYGDALLRVHVDRAGGPARARGPIFWIRVAWDVALTSVEARSAGLWGGRDGTNEVGRGGPGFAGDEGTMMATMGELGFEARITARALLKRPGYALAAVGTLALGIGVASAIFSLVYGSLLKPLPYEDASEVVEIRDLYRSTGRTGSMSVPNFRDLRERTRTLEDFAAFSHRAFNFATEESPQRVRGLAVTSDFLSLLGMAPALGRDFLPEEERPGANQVALISDAMWKDRFGARRDAVGATVLLNGEPVTVVGVLSPDFWFPGDGQVLVPLVINPENRARGSRWLSGVGRVADGVAIETAEEELRGIFAGLPDESGNNEGWTVRLQPIEEFALGNNRRAFELLGAAALLVLLISCVNVANLMLIRFERSQKEVAVRAALGAGRARLTRHFLGEALLLAVAGGVLGLLVTHFGSGLLVALWGDSLPRSEAIGLSGPVVLFTVGSAAVTVLAVGLVPTLRIRAERLFGLLREGGFTGAGSSKRVQQALITAEVSFAVLLVAGAGLLLNSSWRASRIDPGIDLDRALAFQVQLPQAGYEEYEDVIAYYRDAVDRIAALPEVQAVGITDRTPLRGGYNITTLASPSDPELTSSFVEVRRVTPDFFEAAGIPVLQGRGLEESDGLGRAEVVVISERLARDIFPEGDAVGARIHPGWNEDGFRVVGVVGSVRDFGLLGDGRPALYWPFPVPGPSRSMAFVVRTRGEDPLTVAPAIRRVMRELDPTIPVYALETMHDVAMGTLGSRSLATSLFASFGAMALLLAGLGVFGVLAYSVEQRRREIGIRIAIGADAGRVTRTIVLQGLRLVSLGILVGGGAAWFASRYLSDLLYEVSPDDLPTLSIVVLVVLGSSLLAAWLPARRASRVEPTVALNAE